MIWQRCTRGHLHASSHPSLNAEPVTVEFREKWTLESSVELVSWKLSLNSNTKVCKLIRRRHNVECHSALTMLCPNFSNLFGCNWDTECLQLYDFEYLGSLLRLCNRSYSTRRIILVRVYPNRGTAFQVRKNAIAVLFIFPLVWSILRTCELP